MVLSVVTHVLCGVIRCDTTSSPNMVKDVVTTEVNVVIYNVIRLKCVIIWKNML